MNYFLLRIVLFLSVATGSCFGQEIEVFDDLSGFLGKLETEKNRQVLICNAFTTKFGALEKAAQQNTRVHVVCKKSSVKYYDKVKDKNKVVGYHAKEHDKLALMLSCRRIWSAYVGSANLSDGHLKNNTEVVLYIPNAEKMPGLMGHVESLFSRATLFESVTEKYNPRKPQLVTGPKTFTGKRRGSLTSEGVVSCFDFEQNKDQYNLISWMADRIKVDEQRHYCISTMNLDHPRFIDRIKQALRNGSTFNILVWKDEKKLKEAGLLFGLAKYSQNYPDQVWLVWKKGQTSGSGIHHAKLFERYPDERGENGLTIVPTANFTKRGAREHNCAVVLPHASAHEKTIKGLHEKFSNWWTLVEYVPSALQEKPFLGNIADLVVSGVVQDRPCTYYIMTGIWNNQASIASIAEAIRRNSAFNIILLKNWIKTETRHYQKLKELAGQYPNHLLIRSWDKGGKKTMLGGRRILNPHTVFIRSSQYPGLEYLIMSSKNLMSRSKLSKEDTVSTDASVIKQAISDFERILQRTEAV